MTAEPAPPAASPDSSHRVTEDSVSDAFDPLSCFPCEAEANDVMQKRFIHVMPAAIETANIDSVALPGLRGELELNQLREFAARLTRENSLIKEATIAAERRSAAAKSESVALADMDGRIRQAEMVIKQLVEEAGAFKTELDQLREVAARLTSEFSRIEGATRTVEERDTVAGNIDVVSGWRSVGRWLTPVMAVLRQQMPRKNRHQGAVLGGLCVLVLASFIISSSLGDLDQIADQPVVRNAQTVSTASMHVLPEAARSTVVPILPQPMLSTAELKALPRLTPQRAVDAQRRRTPARSPEFMGTLDVQSDPMGAAVFIDRQRVGETPLRLRRLPAGSHVIWIEREGYQRWTAAARVVAETVTRFNVKLQPEPVRSGIE